MALTTQPASADGDFFADAQPPLLKRKRIEQDTEMDITPMIDITFLLLIFFLVASVPDPQTSVELPPAMMGDAADPQLSTIITIGFDTANPTEAMVFVPPPNQPRGMPVEGKVESHRVINSQRNPNAQRDAVVTALEAAITLNKPNVIIKAEARVKNGEIYRILDYISEVAGITPYLAVREER